MLSLGKCIAITRPNFRPNKIIQKDFWAWINMIFNRVDTQRLKVVGPERLCAEWLLKNGASVKFQSTADKLHTDYNTLPEEKTNLGLTEIDGTDSAIMGLGFDHLYGCKMIRKVKLHNCVYVADDALSKLEHIKHTLQDLEISKCPNITDEGLLQLKPLAKLKHLRTFDLPYVKNIQHVENELKASIPKCTFDLRTDKI